MGPCLGALDLTFDDGAIEHVSDRQKIFMMLQLLIPKVRNDRNVRKNVLLKV